MKTAFILALIVAVVNIASSITRIVDTNGAGTYTSINAAIQASTAGDTVKVWPGNYSEQVNLNKDIVLLGSGYETTILTSYADPTVRMSMGKLLWFTVSSLGGDGINLTGGILRNCVINSCLQSGIYSDSGTAFVENSIMVNNGLSGVFANGGTLNVTNCISRSNAYYGFDRNPDLGQLNLSYSNGSKYYTSGNQGWIDEDPLFFSSTDFHISSNSPCWNTGHPTLTDPDGSQSDMGYFGGPDTPIYPVVTKIKIIPLEGGGVRIEAVGVANY